MTKFSKNSKQKVIPSLETKARNSIWDLQQLAQTLNTSIPAFVWGQTAKDYQRLIKLSKELRKQSKAVKKAIKELKHIQIEEITNE